MVSAPKIKCNRHGYPHSKPRTVRRWTVSFLRKLKVWLYIGKVPDICEMSKGEKDYHDYHVEKGGDGTPSHFYTYTCWNCGKKFII